MRFLKPSEVVFAEDKIEREFNKLRESDEIKKYSLCRSLSWSNEEQ